MVNKSETKTYFPKHWPFKIKSKRRKPLGDITRKKKLIRKMTTFPKSSKLTTRQRLKSFCKIVTLEEKLKFSKTCQKQLQNHIKLVLCKKQLQKKPTIRKMTTFQKSLKLATMQRLQPLQNRHFGSKIKILKNMPKTTLQGH